MKDAINAPLLWMLCELDSEFAQSPLTSAAPSAILLGEEIAQAIEAVLPEGTAVGDPIFGCREAGGFNAAGSNSAHLAGADEATLFEHLEMLHDCCQ